ncbi:hypothetical protein PSPO01_15156 [Paraphaeosphaeria sporulosa]
MYGFFGDDWKKGIGPIHEHERCNYMFAAKSVGWAYVRALFTFETSNSNIVIMADSVLFIIGPLLSATVTYRDSMALKNVKGAMKWWQWILVSVDAVQLGFFSFGIASNFQHHPDWVELGVTWAL